MAVTTYIDATNLVVGLCRGGGTDIPLPLVDCTGTAVLTAIIRLST